MSKAAEYRAARKEKQQPTAELTLPSGAVFTVRRPPLEVWMAGGRIPQSFLKASIEPSGAGAMTADDTVDVICFLREAITYAVVEPRLVAGTTAEDELDPADLDPEDFQFLCTWITANCPGVPVATKGGEIAIDDLTKFRQKQPGRTPLSHRDHGADVGDAAEPIVAAV